MSTKSPKDIIQEDNKDTVDRWTYVLLSIDKKKIIKRTSSKVEIPNREGVVREYTIHPRCSTPEKNISLKPPQKVGGAQGWI